jgi:hypothetical protein
MKEAEGAIVDEPQAGSPAARAGLKAGDVIMAVDGKDIKDDRRDLARTIAGMALGTKLTSMSGAMGPPGRSRSRSGSCPTSAKRITPDNIADAVGRTGPGCRASTGRESQTLFSVPPKSVHAPSHVAGTSRRNHRRSRPRLFL